MRFSIISEIPGRTRLQLAGPVPESDLDALLKLSGDIDGVHKVRVYGRIGQMALEYDEPRRASVLDALGALDTQAIADAKSGYVMQLNLIVWNISSKTIRRCVLILNILYFLYNL